jgi:hypothetical protein
MMIRVQLDAQMQVLVPLLVPMPMPPLGLWRETLLEAMQCLRQC